MKVVIHGRPPEQQDGRISVLDHGLLYGDGVFEGIRIYNNKVFFLDRHIDRLYDSAQAICLDIPISPDEMKTFVVDACSQADPEDRIYIRLVVTRGSGTLGLRHDVCSDPQIIAIIDHIALYTADYYENGLETVTAGTKRNLTEAVNPKIKSLNYLNNIMAKIEALNAGVMEAIMLNAQGQVAEATGDNIFAVKGDRMLTPPSWCGALEGITRNEVMRLAREHNVVDVGERVLSRYDLYTADEVFLTGTAAEIIGVSKIDSRVIGQGKPGAITRKLAELYKELTRGTGTDIP